MGKAELHTFYDEDARKDYTMVPEDEYEVKDRAERERQREYFERKEASERDTRHYVNCYHDAITELNEKLDVHEMGAMMKLIPYLRINSGGELSVGNKRMGRVEIRKAIGKSDRWTRGILARLVEAGAIIEAKDGRRKVYNVSERYHTIGHTLKDRYYTKIYQTKTRTDIRNVSIQAAGVLYKMLPFFHYEKFYLCENPNESNPQRLHHLTQAKLARLTNVPKDVINRGVRELKASGFMMMQDSNGAQVIMVNPDVMYRKKDGGDYTDLVRYQFTQTVEKAVADDDNDWLPY